LLGQLKVLMRGFMDSVTVASAGNVIETKYCKSQPQKQPRPRTRSLMTSSQFLVSHGLETINIFPLLRYMKDSKLSQKAWGHREKEGRVNFWILSRSTEFATHDISGRE
jgi:hypothetical protein